MMMSPTLRSAWSEATTISPTTSDRNVGDIIIGPASVRIARLVRGQRGAQPPLHFGGGGRHPQVEAQQFGAWLAAVRAAQGLAWVFEQKADQVGAVVCW